MLPSSSCATRTLVGTILRRGAAAETASTSTSTPNTSFAVQFVVRRATTRSQLQLQRGGGGALLRGCCHRYRVAGAPSITSTAFEGPRRGDPTPPAAPTARRFLSVGRANGESEKREGEHGEESKVVEVTLDGDEGGSEVEKGDGVEKLDLSMYTHEVKLKMPDMGEYDDENPGRVAKWYKTTGDIIRRKDTICDIELEAFTFGIDSDDEGITVMGEIHVPEGDPEPVKPGTPLCTILHPSEEEKGEQPEKKED